jgi:hypothetical protein
MLKRLLAGLPLLHLVLISTPASAFGPNGHKTVGTIADSLLAGTKAGKQARNILGSNLRTASVWADCAKSVNPATFKYENEGQFPECAVYENPARRRPWKAS